ncbi:MAG: UvrD-helicase domain-containing protein [Kiritimatiellae bacterium]|nr:UvrD-helicase domain-containing protein [Kiritimatiellia bacterium]
MTQATNLLIEASAGTGKTQKLAKRLIELIRAGLKPHEITALTFSRAAAGEIFGRFVSLLAESAEKNHADAMLLREAITTQHLSQIGTLDSFLMRIVRSFPLELGLTGDIEIMDDYAAGVERARTSFSILRRTDESTRRTFADAFALAMNRANVRSFSEAYRKFIGEWHELYLAHPEASAWGDPSAIWGEGAPEFTGAAGLEEAARRLEATADAKLAEFAQWVRSFRGGWDGLKGIGKKFFESGDIFKGATVEVDFSRKHYVFAGEAAAAIRAAAAEVCLQAVKGRLDLARGVRPLVAEYEKLYDRQVRRRGRLVFSDVPRLIAELPGDVRLALEYRMDARIRAWALDEFQDTSREQWAAIGPLVEEAKQSAGERSVFIVGDRKQAIYGWRNGDVGIFERERDSGAYEVEELRKTWRSGPAVTAAVNAVFADGPVKDAFPGWFSPVHETARESLGGFVQRIIAPGRKKEDFAGPVFNALAAVDPARRGMSTAVLVRTNDMGELLAAQLRAMGLDGVVWEGESAIADTPALQGFLDLVALADHPGDSRAYRHFRTTPLAAARFGEEVPPAAELSSLAAQAFTERGIVRVFRELRARLPAEARETWSDFTEGRFTDLLRAASGFELSRKPDARLSDFIPFLAAKKKRNIAEPGRIKVMTIHRSKGLGFDWVVLPLYEPKGINTPAEGPLTGPGWILPDPGEKVSGMVPALAEAARERQTRAEQEALCTWYVAMTRAKIALTVVAQPPPKTKTGESWRFSDFVCAALADESGDREWHLAFPLRERAAAGTAEAPQEGGFARGRRERISRRLPSLGFAEGASAGSLFEGDGAREAAMARGTAMHERLAVKGWIDPASPADGLEAAILADPSWRAAFVAPAGNAALWRERGFEIFRNGVWTSGRFDRVVFTGEGAQRRAAVYDFKTNSRRRGETREEFAARLEAAYAGQMAAYREALSGLAGIPPARIETRLLATADLL